MQRQAQNPCWNHAEEQGSRVRSLNKRFKPLLHLAGQGIEQLMLLLLGERGQNMIEQGGVCTRG